MSERPSPIEFMKQTAEADRAKENSKRQQEITRKLVENSGVFGGQIEEERSQKVCQEIFDVFGSKYESVKGMESVAQNPSATDRQKGMARENLGVLGKAAFVSINYSFKEYPGGLITSQLRAEEIDDFLPDELKGLGEYVVKADKNATEEEKKQIKEMEIVGRLKTDDYDLTEEAILAAKSLSAEDSTSKYERQGSLFQMKPSDIVNLEMAQRNKDQFYFNPPYPDWLKKLSPDDRKLWMARVKLLNGVVYKQSLRNIDAEKLMQNRGLDLSKGEFKLLCEMPHFQEATRTFVKDLFEWENEKSGGERYLKLKQRETSKGRVIIDEVEEKLTHFEAYKEKLALKMQYPGQDADKMYLEGKRANGEFRGAVGAAWNFLYIGNIIESADVDRQLKPTEIVSDKLRTMIHPLQKALGKWGVYKEGKGIIMGITGEEEPMGGDIASWVKYHLELDEIKRDLGVFKKNESSFRQKLVSGEIKPLPKRTACSLIEMIMIETEHGEKTMVEALMAGEEIKFDIAKNNLKLEEKDKSRDNELDIFTEFKDTMDGCKTAYTYLSGGSKLEIGKNEYEWARKFNADIALIRQMNEGKKKGRVNTLSFVNDPEFIAWVIAASAGFDIKGNRIVLNRNIIKANSANYDVVVKRIINLPGLVELNSRNGKIEQILGADLGYLGTKRMLNKHEFDMSDNESYIRKYNKKYRNTSGRNYKNYGI